MVNAVPLSMASVHNDAQILWEVLSLTVPSPHHHRKGTGLGAEPQRTLSSPAPEIREGFVATAQPKEN